MKSLLQAAEELGIAYVTLRKYVIKHISFLKEKGLVVAKQSIKRSRYFVPDPVLLLKTIKEIEGGNDE